jgi:hypothetical protein
VNRSTINPVSGGAVNASWGIKEAAAFLRFHTDTITGLARAADRVAARAGTRTRLV